MYGLCYAAWERNGVFPTCKKLHVMLLMSSECNAGNLRVVSPLTGKGGIPNKTVYNVQDTAR